MRFDSSATILAIFKNLTDLDFKSSIFLDERRNKNFEYETILRLEKTTTTTKDWRSYTRVDYT